MNIFKQIKKINKEKTKFNSRNTDETIIEQAAANDALNQLGEISEDEQKYYNKLLKTPKNKH